MDYRIARIEDAYSRGDFAEARQLAEAALREEESNQDLLDQAVTLIILSHAAEGDVEAAREAAGRLAPIAPSACEECLAYVDADAAAREARVAALQRDGGSALSPETRLRLAQTYDLAGDLYRAADLYADLIADHPDDRAAGAAVSQLLLIWLETEGPEAARKEALAIIQQYLDSPAVLRGAVRAYAWTYLTEADTFGGLCAVRELGDASSNLLLRHEAAAAEVQLVWAHLGGYPPTHARRGSPQLEQGITFTAWALNQHLPGYDRILALGLLGWLHQWNGEDEAALPYFEQRAVSPYASPYMAVKAWKSVLATLPRAGKGDQQPDTLAWAAIVDERMRQSEWPDYSPNQAEPWLGGLTTEEWYAVARATEELSHTEASDSPWAALAAAHAYARAQFPERALTCLQEVVNRWPERRESQVAAVELTKLLTEEGRFAEAIAACEGLLTKHPPSEIESAAQREIARARLCRGDGEEALERYRHLIAHAPSSPEAGDAVRTIAELTSCCLGSGAVVSAMRSIVDQHPRSAAADSARFAMGEVYAAQDLPELAEEAWQALVTQRPGSEMSTDARRSLAQLRYAKGTAAFFVGNYAGTVRWLEPLARDLDFFENSAVRSASPVAHRHIVTTQRRQVALYLGEAYRRLGQESAANRVLGLLNTAGNSDSRPHVGSSE